MKNMRVGFLLCLCFLGCDEKEPLKKAETENGWRVEYCFQHDGAKVYRFSTMEGWKYYVIAESNAQVLENVKTDSDDNKVRIPQSQTIRK